MPCASRITNGRNQSFDVSYDEQYESDDEQHAAQDEQRQSEVLIPVGNGARVVRRHHAGQGKDEHEPRQERVGHRRVEDEVLAHEVHQDADKDETERGGRRVGDRLRISVVDLRDPDGQVEKCGQVQPRAVHREAIVDEQANQPDVDLTATEKKS